MKKTSVNKLNISVVVSLFATSMVVIAGLASSMIIISNTPTMEVQVEVAPGDTTAPIVEAAFLPNHVKKVQGIFEVDFQATDDIDPDPQVTAIFNISWPVDQWTVISKIGDSDMKIEIDYDNNETTIKGQSPSVIEEHIKEFGGLKVSDGQKWKIELDLEDGEVVIKLDEDESYSLYDPITETYIDYEELKIEIENETGNPYLMVENLLYVTAIDDSGNVGFAYATPLFDKLYVEVQSTDEQTTEEESTDDSTDWSTPSDSISLSNWNTDDITSGFEIISIIGFIAACVFLLKRRRKSKTKY
ncbi:MAG: hypothetical protein ACW98I_20235 [Candidatus Hodarchaeales archaeon]|jgi:hypothetical protein